MPSNELVAAVAQAKANGARSAEQVLEALRRDGAWEGTTLPQVRRAVTEVNASIPAEAKAAQRKERQREREQKRDRSSGKRPAQERAQAEQQPEQQRPRFERVQEGQEIRCPRSGGVPFEIEDLLDSLTDGHTIGTDALRERLIDLVAVWLQAGGDANATTGTNATAPTLLQQAAMHITYVPPRVFELLLQHGARVDFANHASERAWGAPIQWVTQDVIDSIEKGYTDLVYDGLRVMRLLRNAGACVEDADLRRLREVTAAWLARSASHDGRRPDGACPWSDIEPRHGSPDPETAVSLFASYDRLRNLGLSSDTEATFGTTRSEQRAQLTTGHARRWSI